MFFKLTNHAFPPTHLNIESKAGLSMIQWSRAYSYVWDATSTEQSQLGSAWEVSALDSLKDTLFSVLEGHNRANHDWINRVCIASREQQPWPTRYIASTWILDSASLALRLVFHPLYYISETKETNWLIIIICIEGSTKIEHKCSQIIFVPLSMYKCKVLTHSDSFHPSIK